MSKIKKFWGLICIGFLSISAFLGVTIRMGGSEIPPTKTTSQEKFYAATGPVAEAVIEIEQPKYVCVEDLLEIDENTLTFASYENVEIAECIMVGCGGIF